MEEKFRQEILDAVSAHPGIEAAAITGSQARGHRTDSLSDLDLLLVARDTAAVRDVPGWFPRSRGIWICEFHLEHYCTVLLESFEKVDLAIFPADADPALWVVQDYRRIKGDDIFELRLATAAATTERHHAAHRNRDASIDNILLLLATARLRVERGEDLSAHGLVGMAAAMLAALERRERGMEPGGDTVDPWRRLETARPELARVLQECLFAPPSEGILRMARHMAQTHEGCLNEGQAKALRHLGEPYATSDRNTASA
jgi:hypothetical protein